MDKGTWEHGNMGTYLYVFIWVQVSDFLAVDDRDRRRERGKRGKEGQGEVRDNGGGTGRGKG